MIFMLRGNMVNCHFRNGPVTTAGRFANGLKAGYARSSPSNVHIALKRLGPNKPRPPVKGIPKQPLPVGKHRTQMGSRPCQPLRGAKGTDTKFLLFTCQHALDTQGHTTPTGARHSSASLRTPCPTCPIFHNLYRQCHVPYHETCLSRQL